MNILRLRNNICVSYVCFLYFGFNVVDIVDKLFFKIFLCLFLSFIYDIKEEIVFYI